MQAWLSTKYFVMRFCPFFAFVVAACCPGAVLCPCAFLGKANRPGAAGYAVRGGEFEKAFRFCEVVAVAVLLQDFQVDWFPDTAAAFGIIDAHGQLVVFSPGDFLGDIK